MTGYTATECENVKIQIIPMSALPHNFLHVNIFPIFSNGTSAAAMYVVKANISRVKYFMDSDGILGEDEMK